MKKEGTMIENIMLCIFFLHITLALHCCKGSYTKKNCGRWL